MKKLKRFLKIYDALWSLPLAFATFWLVGIILTGIFGAATGTYDLGFIQPLFLAIGVAIGANTAALGFLWFTCRGLFKWFFGEKIYGHPFKIPAKADWKTLAPHWKFIIFFLVLFGMMGLIVLVYLNFI